MVGSRVLGWMAAALLLAACNPGTETDLAEDPEVAGAVAMGGEKSVTNFFITSQGSGDGANLGGLAGADAHCQALAQAQGAGDHSWRAYLSTQATDAEVAVNARERIGQGPWYNAEGVLVAANLEELHGEAPNFTKETALTEVANPVNGRGDTPNQHDILTGSTAEGMSYPAGEDATCGNWTSNGEGSARVGHHDRQGGGDAPTSWNSAHNSRGCSQEDLIGTGGNGYFYCFAID
jgi:hypothetical protein